MLLFAADLGKEAAQVGVRAGLTVLESSILGAITLVSTLLTVWAIWKLSKVQDQRVSDLEKQNDKMQELVMKMTGTFAEVSKSLDSMGEAADSSERALGELKSAVNGVVMEAVRSLRSHYRDPRWSPSGGIPAVQQPKEK